MIYKVLFKGGGTYIVLSLENVSVLSQLLKIDFVSDQNNPVL